ncbi:hypothetical protein PQQ99_38395 [Paraburkholderia sediminicola]|uniref:hypothetical protein n=1 Tax=Paraburkholderia sediminicola TaxID=458836 RepID=UPI0038BD9AE5
MVKVERIALSGHIGGAARRERNINDATNDGWRIDLTRMSISARLKTAVVQIAINESGRVLG